MEKLFLSKRNLVTLLQKLDSLRDGEACSCTIIKSDYAHPLYPQTVRRVAVTAVESGDRYFDAVSKRIDISRASLNALLESLDRQIQDNIEFDGMSVAAVPDESYYGAHETGVTPIGHVSTEPLKK